ncbi:MAG: hypothetical protein V4709_09560 [Pseudomonadota bacterium]
MDEKLFSQLMESVRWMKKHMKGEATGGRVTVLESVEVKRIPTVTALTQDQFANVIHKDSRQHS